MKDNKHSRLKKLSISSAILLVIAIGSTLFIMSNREVDPDTHYKNMLKKHYKVFSPIIPNKVSFCGEEVPIDNIFVREALDRELVVIMYQHSNTFMIMKRAGRYFPEIERILKEEGVPDDLKYLAVAESALTNAVSPAKAEGYWQFLASTAKAYGLEVSPTWDDRYDLAISTRAAARYLKSKHKAFNNDWALASASYNAGERGVRNRMREQGCDNYWDLLINTETSRYVYRIIAYKIIMENPHNYGYYLREKDVYREIDTRVVEVDTSIASLFKFAEEMNIPYLQLKRLNPALRSNKLDNKSGKTYKIRIPKKGGISYKKSIKNIGSKKFEFEE